MWKLNKIMNKRKISKSSYSWEYNNVYNVNSDTYQTYTLKKNSP